MATITKIGIICYLIQTADSLKISFYLHFGRRYLQLGKYQDNEQILEFLNNFKSWQIKCQVINLETEISLT